VGVLGHGELESWLLYTSVRSLFVGVGASFLDSL
jgi:hypothetical protein